MREIFCCLDPFAMSQEVLWFNDETKQPEALFSASIDNLGVKLAEAAAANNWTNIKIIGNDTFAEKVINDFWTKSGELYSNQNVKIEVLSNG